MIVENLAYKDNFFEEKIQWDYLVTESQKVFNLSNEEVCSLYNSRTAKIIAAIPFEAECKFPERYAISHLLCYIAEKKGFEYFTSHCCEDDNDIFSRLAPISNFEGGNSNIIQHGMNMLALIMLEGYKESFERDSENGIYNPLVSAKWDYEVEKYKLLRRISMFKNHTLDYFFLESNQNW